MISVPIGVINGKKLKFHQCVSLDEAKEKKLPQGIYFYWQEEGSEEKIFDPGKIVGNIMQDIQKGSFEPKNIITQDKLKSFYQEICNHQMKMMESTLKDQLERLKKTEGCPPEYIAQLEKQIEDHKLNMTVLPDESGARTLKTAEDAERIYRAGMMHEAYTPEALAEKFGIKMP